MSDDVQYMKKLIEGGLSKEEIFAHLRRANPDFTDAKLERMYSGAMKIATIPEMLDANTIKKIQIAASTGMHTEEGMKYAMPKASPAERGKQLQRLYVERDKLLWGGMDPSMVQRHAKFNQRGEVVGIGDVSPIVKILEMKGIPTARESVATSFKYYARYNRMPPYKKGGYVPTGRNMARSMFSRVVPQRKPVRAKVGLNTNTMDFGGPKKSSMVRLPNGKMIDILNVDPYLMHTILQGEHASVPDKDIDRFKRHYKSVSHVLSQSYNQMQKLTNERILDKQMGENYAIQMAIEAKNAEKFLTMKDNSSFSYLPVARQASPKGYSEATGFVSSYMDVTKHFPGLNLGKALEVITQPAGATPSRLNRKLESLKEDMNKVYTSAYKKGIPIVYSSSHGRSLVRTAFNHASIFSAHQADRAYNKIHEDYKQVFESNLMQNSELWDEYQKVEDSGDHSLSHGAFFYDALRDGHTLHPTAYTRIYTSSTVDHIQNVLRGKQKHLDQYSDEMIKTILSHQAAWEEYIQTPEHQNIIGQMPHETVSFRGYSGKAAEKLHHYGKPGFIFPDKGNLSFSHSPKTATTFASEVRNDIVLGRIQLGKKIPWVPGYPEESEQILPPMDMQVTNAYQYLHMDSSYPMYMESMRLLDMRPASEKRIKRADGGVAARQDRLMRSFNLFQHNLQNTQMLGGLLGFAEGGDPEEGRVLYRPEYPRETELYKILNSFDRSSVSSFNGLIPRVKPFGIGMGDLPKMLNNPSLGSVWKTRASEAQSLGRTMAYYKDRNLPGNTPPIYSVYSYPRDVLHTDGTGRTITARKSIRDFMSVAYDAGSYAEGGNPSVSRATLQDNMRRSALKLSMMKSGLKLKAMKEQVQQQKLISLRNAQQERLVASQRKIREMRYANMNEQKMFALPFGNSDPRAYRGRDTSVRSPNYNRLTSIDKMHDAWRNASNVRVGRSMTRANNYPAFSGHTTTMMVEDFMNHQMSQIDGRNFTYDMLDGMTSRVISGYPGTSLLQVLNSHGDHLSETVLMDDFQDSRIKNLQGIIFHNGLDPHGKEIGKVETHTYASILDHMHDIGRETSPIRANMLSHLNRAYPTYRTTEETLELRGFHQGLNNDGRYYKFADYDMNDIMEDFPAFNADPGSLIDKVQKLRDIFGIQSPGNGGPVPHGRSRLLDDGISYSGPSFSDLERILPPDYMGGTINGVSLNHATRVNNAMIPTIRQAITLGDDIYKLIHIPPNHTFGREETQFYQDMYQQSIQGLDDEYNKFDQSGESMRLRGTNYSRHNLNFLDSLVGSGTSHSRRGIVGLMNARTNQWVGGASYTTSNRNSRTGSPDSLYVDLFGMRGSLRGQGLGSRVFTELMASSHDAGIETFDLTPTGFQETHAFYQRHGGVYSGGYDFNLDTEAPRMIQEHATRDLASLNAYRPVFQASRRSGSNSQASRSERDRKRAIRRANRSDNLPPFELNSLGFAVHDFLYNQMDPNSGRGINPLHGMNVSSSTLGDLTTLRAMNSQGNVLAYASLSDDMHVPRIKNLMDVDFFQARNNLSADHIPIVEDALYNAMFEHMRRIGRSTDPIRAIDKSSINYTNPTFEDTMLRYDFSQHPGGLNEYYKYADVDTNRALRDFHALKASGPGMNGFLPEITNIKALLSSQTGSIPQAIPSTPSSGYAGTLSLDQVKSQLPPEYFKGNINGVSLNHATEVENPDFSQLRQIVALDGELYKILNFEPHSILSPAEQEYVRTVYNASDQGLTDETQKFTRNNMTMQRVASAFAADNLDSLFNIVDVAGGDMQDHGITAVVNARDNTWIGGASYTATDFGGNSPSTYVDLFGMRGSMRGRGLGSRAFVEMMQFNQASGVEDRFSLSPTSFPETHAFYQRHGGVNNYEFDLDTHVPRLQEEQMIRDEQNMNAYQQAIQSLAATNTRGSNLSGRRRIPTDIRQYAYDDFDILHFVPNQRIDSDAMSLIQNIRDVSRPSIMQEMSGYHSGLTADPRGMLSCGTDYANDNLSYLHQFARAGTMPNQGIVAAIRPDDELLGALRYTMYDPRTTYVNYFGVRGNVRGGGIGAKMFSDSLLYANEIGVNDFSLTATNFENTKRFYRDKMLGTPRGTGFTFDVGNAPKLAQRYLYPDLRSQDMSSFTDEDLLHMHGNTSTFNTALTALNQNPIDILKQRFGRATGGSIPRLEAGGDPSRRSPPLLKLKMHNSAKRIDQLRALNQMRGERTLGDMWNSDFNFNVQSDDYKEHVIKEIYRSSLRNVLSGNNPLVQNDEFDVFMQRSDSIIDPKGIRDVHAVISPQFKAFHNDYMSSLFNGIDNTEQDNILSGLRKASIQNLDALKHAGYDLNGVIGNIANDLYYEQGRGIKVTNLPYMDVGSISFKYDPSKAMHNSVMNTAGGNMPYIDLIREYINSYNSEYNPYVNPSLVLRDAVRSRGLSRAEFESYDYAVNRNKDAFNYEPGNLSLNVDKFKAFSQSTLSDTITSLNLGIGDSATVQTGKELAKKLNLMKPDLYAKLLELSGEPVPSHVFTGKPTASLRKSLREQTPLSRFDKAELDFFDGFIQHSPDLVGTNMEGLKGMVLSRGLGGRRMNPHDFGNPNDYDLFGMIDEGYIKPDLAYQYVSLSPDVSKFFSSQSQEGVMLKTVIDDEMLKNIGYIGEHELEFITNRNMGWNIDKKLADNVYQATPDFRKRFEHGGDPLSSARQKYRFINNDALDNVRRLRSLYGMNQDKALMLYKGMGYDTINRYLETGEINDPLINASPRPKLAELRMKNTIPFLDKATSLHTPPRTMLYKGLSNYWSKFLMDKQIGDTVTFPGYLSTSTDLSVATKHNQMGIATIFTDPQTRGYNYVKNGYDAFSENEFLLQRGQTFGIEHMRPVGDGNGRVNYILRHHANRAIGGEGGIPALISNNEAYLSPSLVSSVGTDKLDILRSLADDSSLKEDIPALQSVFGKVPTFGNGMYRITGGRGGPTSDDIAANLQPGSYILDYQTLEALRALNPSNVGFSGTFKGMYAGGKYANGGLIGFAHGGSPFVHNYMYPQNTTQYTTGADVKIQTRGLGAMDPQTGQWNADPLKEKANQDAVDTYEDMLKREFTNKFKDVYGSIDEAEKHFSMERTPTIQKRRRGTTEVEEEVNRLKPRFHMDSGTPGQKGDAQKAGFATQEDFNTWINGLTNTHFRDPNAGGSLLDTTVVKLSETEKHIQGIGTQGTNLGKLSHHFADLSFRLASVSMAAMGVNFSFMALFQTVMNNVGKIAQPFTDLEGLMQNSGYIKAFGDKIGMTGEQIQNLTGDTNGYIETWKKMTAVNSMIMMSFARLGANILGSTDVMNVFNENMAKIFKELSTPESTKTFSEFLKSMIQSLPMVVDLLKVVTGALKFFSDRPQLMGLMMWATVISMMVQPIFSLGSAALTTSGLIFGFTNHIRAMGVAISASRIGFLGLNSAMASSLLYVGALLLAWEALARLGEITLNISMPKPSDLISGGMEKLFGGVPGNATGDDYVTGAGTSTSDSVLRRLSVGERVIPADLNKKNFWAYEALESGNLKGYATGVDSIGAVTDISTMDNRYYSSKTVDMNDSIMKSSMDTADTLTTAREGNAIRVIVKNAKDFGNGEVSESEGGAGVSMGLPESPFQLLNPAARGMHLDAKLIDLVKSKFMTRGRSDLRPDDRFDDRVDDRFDDKFDERFDKRPDDKFDDRFDEKVFDGTKYQDSYRWTREDTKVYSDSRSAMDKIKEDFGRVGKWFQGVVQTPIKPEGATTLDAIRSVILGGGKFDVGASALGFASPLDRFSMASILSSGRYGTRSAVVAETMNQIVAGGVTGLGVGASLVGGSMLAARGYGVTGALVAAPGQLVMKAGPALAAAQIGMFGVEGNEAQQRYLGGESAEAIKMTNYQDLDTLHRAMAVVTGQYGTVSTGNALQLGESTIGKESTVNAVQGMQQMAGVMSGFMDVMMGTGATRNAFKQFGVDLPGMGELASGVVTSAIGTPQTVMDFVGSLMNDDNSKPTKTGIEGAELISPYAGVTSWNTTEGNRLFQQDAMNLTKEYNASVEAAKNQESNQNVNNTFIINASKDEGDVIRSIVENALRAAGYYDARRA